MSRTLPRPAPVDFNWITLDEACVNPFTMRLTVDASLLSRIVPHVPNGEYLRWLETMAVAHADSLGYTNEWHIEHNVIWFVRRHEIDYLAEVREGDELDMATWVEGFNKASSPRRYLVYRPADETLVCAARTIWVLVSRDKSRPQRVDAAMAQRYLGTDHPLG